MKPKSVKQKRIKQNRIEPRTRNFKLKHHKRSIKKKIQQIKICLMHHSILKLARERKTKLKMFILNKQGKS